MAVLKGITAFNENTARTKARMQAKSYISSKPDKYGIRFYANVEWNYLYMHSIWDNNSGNEKTITSENLYFLSIQIYTEQ